ncbi:MAG: PTS sugar transporter subunit IIC [Lachnospiraceae bacterium]|nr:PTS sugar transporter subunit IIC [Lachnospiraceae bacterium]
MLQALLVYLAVVACFFVHYFLGNCLTDRPIIVGTVVGLVLGDMQTGIMVGATYELIFLGVTNAGGVVPANTALGTAVGVAMTILSGMDAESSLALAVPVALLGSQLITLMYTLRSMLNPMVERMIEKAEYKKIEAFVFIQAIVSYLIIFIPVFLVVAFGVDLINNIMAAIPSFVISGLSVASGMLAAVGFGMLLKLVWVKNIAVFFFVGYILSAYLGLPVLGVALCGVTYAVITYFNEKDKKVAVPVLAGGEDLFND